MSTKPNAPKKVTSEDEVPRKYWACRGNNHYMPETRTSIEDVEYNPAGDVVGYTKVQECERCGVKRTTVIAVTYVLGRAHYNIISGPRYSDYPVDGYLSAAGRLDRSQFTLMTDLEVIKRTRGRRRASA